MSGSGRLASILAETGEAPRSRHKSRWQARIEGMDGRTIKAVKGPQRAARSRLRQSDIEADLGDLRAAGYRVR